MGSTYTGGGGKPATAARMYCVAVFVCTRPRPPLDAAMQQRTIRCLLQIVSHAYATQVYMCVLI